ncbi:type VII secretion protein EccB [Gordonia zhaorongruii]|uniref:type VII secretion protein EccB n=1 Tax=Gordonia zhaorongruii TaxID=2597659 RepID=UPI00104E7F20|nr:type VII secretion protein EccB [Gordonia zhaorongruii]
MSRRITTRAQVSGYRFGLARAEHALIRWDVRMLHDPMRSQGRAIVAGLVVAVLILAGAGVYGLIRPAPSVGDARIVADSGGGLFVLVDGVMHPVLNLASARLIVGGPAPVKTVGPDSLAEFPRGAALGIPGAPASLPGPAVDGASTWTVCDTPAGTAVLSGVPAGRPLPPGHGVLVSHGDRTWLLFTESGAPPVRAGVDTESTAVLRALGIEGRQPVPVSAALLDAFPVRPPLRVPDVPGRGTKGPIGLPVGSVIRTAAVDGAVAYRVVLVGGMQELPSTAADMLRAADPSASPTIRNVAPGALTAVPVVDPLPVGHFPRAAPRMAGGESVLCRSWSRTRDESRARESLYAVDALPVPDAGRPVALGSADGRGPGLDAVYLPPATAEYVTVTGARGDSALAGQRFLIADTGVRHRLAGAEAADGLGLDDVPPRAPWSVISLLPEGADLSRAAALVARDAVAVR